MQIINTLSVNNTSKSAPSQCRFCFEQTKKNDPLITPCSCQGSLKYIHQSCIDKWVITKYGSNVAVAYCEICKDKLLIKSTETYFILRRKCVVITLLICIFGICFGYIAVEICCHIKKWFDTLVFEKKFFKIILLISFVLLIVGFYCVIMIFIIKGVKYKCYKMGPNRFNVINKEQEDTENSSNDTDQNSSNKIRGKDLKMIMHNNYLSTSHNFDRISIQSLPRLTNINNN